MMFKEHEWQIQEARKGNPHLQKCQNIKPRKNMTCFVCGKKGHVAKDYLDWKLLIDSKEKEKSTNLVEKINDLETFLIMKKSCKLP